MVKGAEVRKLSQCKYTEVYLLLIDSYTKLC